MDIQPQIKSFFLGVFACSLFLKTATLRDSRAPAVGAVLLHFKKASSPRVNMNDKPILLFNSLSARLPRTPSHKVWMNYVRSCFVFAAILFCALGAEASEKDQTPKEIVVRFYELALKDLKPKEAFALYAAPDFVEHSADSTGGTAQSTIEFLTNLIKKSPQPKWEILRVIAEGEMVFLHARFTPAKDATPISVGEIFRVHDGKIAEHWDIIQPAPEHPTNPNSIF